MCIIFEEESWITHARSSPKNIHSIVNSVVVNNQMQKGKKKEPKMNCEFWHDLHDLKLVVKLILKRPRTYLDSRKHDDTVNHYQLTSFVQYTIYHQCC